MVDDSSENSLRRAADAVTLGRSRLNDLGGDVQARARLLATGYDMDNMKARAFIESEMPLHLPPADGSMTSTMPCAGSFRRREAEGLLRFAVRAALFVKATAGSEGFQKARRRAASSISPASASGSARRLRSAT